jgi:hypothetical protein
MRADEWGRIPDLDAHEVTLDDFLTTLAAELADAWWAGHPAG